MRKNFAQSLTLLVAISALPGSQQSARASVQQQSVAATAATSVSGKDSQTGKQRALADQAKRLVDMATDLKTQVAKTNKNILSLEVVRKAEEIEALAHRMKEQAKPVVR